MKTVTITKDEFIDKSTTEAAKIVKKLREGDVDTLMCVAVVDLLGIFSTKLITEIFGKEEENDI